MSQDLTPYLSTRDHVYNAGSVHDVHRHNTPV